MKVEDCVSSPTPTTLEMDKMKEVRQKDVKKKKKGRKKKQQRTEYESFKNKFPTMGRAYANDMKLNAHVRYEVFIRPIILI